MQPNYVEVLVSVSFYVAEGLAVEGVFGGEKVSFSCLNGQALSQLETSHSELKRPLITCARCILSLIHMKAHWEEMIKSLSLGFILRTSITGGNEWGGLSFEWAVCIRCAEQRTDYVPVDFKSVPCGRQRELCH